MGCVSSKKARTQSPDFDPPVIRDTGSRNSDYSRHSRNGFGPLEKIREEPEKEKDKDEEPPRQNSGNLKALKKGNSQKKAVFSIKFGRLTESEHVAAGWPAWLSAVAGEAVDGWLPLRSDTFERLEKIGQGTYSSVYRARDVDTGRMVALKKVRFDNFQPESVRFMAREIIILRKLDHPNIMKLEGIITSRLSCSIYLVFEYMEHDLSGLLTCPDIKFNESQVKCFMRQLLCGLEHCHSRGIMHRDIKVSNILVNNEGILKIGDFGLANFLSAKHKQPLTSRVVTLWYRPPELLLGSTSYGVTVDLWSVGCVFAELFLGRPILKGRNEVEQLHKIFKLCGSPSDEYWKASKLPLATMFKPQHPYESTLRERCRELPKSAVHLIEMLLSVDPYKRGTASSALNSEYFNIKPYACDPSSLPKYPPNKEIDAKLREEARRKRAGLGLRQSAALRNPRVRKSLQESSNFFKVVPTEEVEANIQVARRNKIGYTHMSKGKGATEYRMSLKPSYDTVSQASQMTDESQGDSSIRSVPIQMPTSSGFAWAKKEYHNSSTRLRRHATSKSQQLTAVDPPNILLAADNMISDWNENNDFSGRAYPARRPDETAKHSMHERRTQLHPLSSFDSSDIYEPQGLSMDYKYQRDRVRSGPLFYPSQSSDVRQDGQTHQHVQKSRFHKDT